MTDSYIMLNKSYVSILIVLVVALAGVTSCIGKRDAGQQSASGSSDIPKIAFEKYTLPNGLDVILSRDQRVPMVAVNLWYHVGPANEEPGRTGFAHLFEHMMFQSSKHVPPDSHFKLLEAAGASDINGTTDYDRTNYFETVPSNQLELAIWLESDRMGYLLDKVDQAALSNQQDVVRNERRQSVENQPYGLAEETLIQNLFPKGHPYYGNVIGSHEDIQAVKLDDVRRFFKQVLLAQQREPRDRRRLRSCVREIARREVLQHAEAWRGRSCHQGGDAQDHVGTPRGGEVARRASSRLHGVGDVADSQAR